MYLLWCDNILLCQPIRGHLFRQKRTLPFCCYPPHQKKVTLQWPASTIMPIFLRITYRYPWLMIKIWGRNDATSNFGIPLNVSMVKWCANKMYMAPLISAGYMKTFKCAPVHAPRKEYFSQLLSTVVEHDITSHLTSNFIAFLMTMTIWYLITFGPLP